MTTPKSFVEDHDLPHSFVPDDDTAEPQAPEATPSPQVVAPVGVVAPKEASSGYGGLNSALLRGVEPATAPVQGPVYEPDLSSGATLSQGDKIVSQPPKISDAKSRQLGGEKEYQIPGTEIDTGVSPNSIRAGLDGVTLGTAPRLLASIESMTEDKPFDVGLHEWHDLYSQANEDHQIASNVGGLLTPLPFGKLGVVGKMALGGTAGAISGWMQADPWDEAMKKRSALLGFGQGAVMVGALHEAPKIFKAPPRIAILSAPQVGDIGSKLNEATAQHFEIDSPSMAKGTKGSAERFIDPEPGKEWQPKKAWKAPVATADTTPVGNIASKTVRQQQAVAKIFAELQTDPSNVPKYKVEDPASMKVFDGALVDDHGQPTAVLREITGKGIGIYEHPINTPEDALKFNRLKYKHAPDVAFNFGYGEGLDNMSEEMKRMLITNPNCMSAAAANIAKSEAKAAAGGSDPNATKPNASLTPKDEAPVGRPNPEPGMLVMDPDTGAPKIVTLMGHEARTASLMARGIVSIETKAGTRYARLLRNADSAGKDHVVIQPFDVDEGIPSIARTSRVKRSAITLLDEAGTKKAYNSISSIRERMGVADIQEYPGLPDYGNQRNELLQTRETDQVNMGEWTSSRRTNYAKKFGRPDVHEAPPEGAVVDQGANALGTQYDSFEPSRPGEYPNDPYGATTPSNGRGPEIAPEGGIDSINYEGANSGTYVNDRSGEIGNRGGGGKPPEPPSGPEPMPPSDPPGPPPAAESNLRQIMGDIGKNAGLYDKARRQLVGAHLRAPMDFAGFVSDMQSVKNVEKSWVNITTAMERKLGKKGTVEFRQDVHSLFTGDLSKGQFEKLAETKPGYAEAWSSIREMVGQAEARRAANQLEELRLGIINFDTYSKFSSKQNLDSYATREYAATTLPAGEWLPIVKKDARVWGRAIEEVKKLNPGFDDVQAEAKLRDSFTKEDPAGELFGKSKSGGANKFTSKLQERMDLKPWYREFLGENRNGPLTIGRTLANQEANIANAKVWAGMLSHPEWIGDRALAPDWVQLDNSPALYGKAAGKWIDPIAHDALVTLPNAKHESGKWVSAILGVVKTNQVSLGSMRTFVNMAMDNMMGGVLSGGIDLTRPLATGKAVSFALKAMNEYRKNPISDNVYSRFIQDARRIGVDAPGHIGGDMATVQRTRINAELEKLGEHTGDYTSWLKKANDAHQRLGAAGSVYVDGIDLVHKLASWKMIVDDMIAKGQSPETASRTGARRIFQSYPMYDRAGPLADKMSSSAMGIVSPYAKFAMERNRVFGTLPGRLLSKEDPGLKWRLMKYAAITAGLYGANGYVRNHFGNVSQQDVDAAMVNRQGTSQERFNPIPWIMPYRDPTNGKVVIMDLTQWAAPLSYLQGDPNLVKGFDSSLLNTVATGAGNVAMNIVKAPFQGGAVGNAIDMAAKSAGMQSGFDRASPMPGTSKVGNVAQLIAESGGMPRMAMDAYGNAQKGGLLGSTRNEPMSPMAAGLRTAGVPIEQEMSVGTGKSLGLRGKVGNEAAGIGHAVAILRRAALMKPDKSMPMLNKLVDLLDGSDVPEKVNIRKAAIEEIKKHQKELGDAYRANRKAKESHK